MVPCVRETKNTTFFVGDSIIKVFLKHTWGRGNFYVLAKFSKNLQSLTDVWILAVYTSCFTSVDVSVSVMSKLGSVKCYAMCNLS